jgi:hypothetical protein
MTNRRRTLNGIFAAAFIALLLPTLTASAQSNDPWWGRGRGNRNDDRYGYNSRALRDAVRRVENRSGDFQDHLDSALDHSRYDDSRREDRINGIGREFHNAAHRLKDRFNERDFNRSRNEASQLLQIGSRINQFMSRNRLDSRVMSDWNEISSNLRVIADAYNLNYHDHNDGFYRGNDDYRNRDRDRDRDDNNRRAPNDRGWRWPF